MMKRKNIIRISAILILSLMLSLNGGLSVVPAQIVSAAEKNNTAIIEKVLIPEEKCWKYRENNDDTVSIIGFDDREEYTWEDREEEYTLEEDIYIFQPYKLIIPQTINGKKVIYVGGDDFFSYREITCVQIPEGVENVGELGISSIVSVELPSTLKTIDRYAFYNCKLLKNIELPAGLETIDSHALYGCWSLENINIPTSVSYIDSESAFADCRGMKSFEVEDDNKGGYYSENGILYKKWMDEVPVYGDQVDEDGEPIVEFYKDVERKTLISYPGSKEGEYTLNSDTDYSWTAFLNCKGLKAIHVSSDHPDYASEDGVLFDKDMRILRVCPAGKTGEYTVPEGVISLQTNSFSNSGLHTIHLPDSLEEKYETEWGFIGGYAFYQCEALHTISIGENTTDTILSYLDDVPNLKKITVSENNPNLYATENIVFDKDIKKLLLIPAGITGKLILPDTVESSHSVVGGTGITELVLGANYNVTIRTYKDEEDGIQYNYVKGLPTLEYLQVYEVSSANKNLAAQDGILYSKDMKKLYCCPPEKKGIVTIPEGTTTIFGEAFEDCSEVEEIIIPASVTEIQDEAFSSRNLIIKGYAGSAAEEYVKRVNVAGGELKFVVLSKNTETPDQISKEQQKQPGVAIDNKKEPSIITVKKPKKVTLNTVKALKKQKVKVMWKRLVDSNGYQLQYAVNRSFTKKKKTKNISKKSTNVTLKKLKKGKTYYFRIRAYKLNGSKKVYGEWSKVKKIKIKK